MKVPANRITSRLSIVDKQPGKFLWMAGKLRTEMSNYHANQLHPHMQPKGKYESHFCSRYQELKKEMVRDAFYAKVKP